MAKYIPKGLRPGWGRFTPEELKMMRQSGVYGDPSRGAQPKPYQMPTMEEIQKGSWGTTGEPDTELESHKESMREQLAVSSKKLEEAKSSFEAADVKLMERMKQTLGRDISRQEFEAYKSYMMEQQRLKEQAIDLSD